MSIKITRPDVTAGSEVLGMIRRRKYAYVPGLLLNRAVQYAEAMKSQQLERAVEELESLNGDIHDEIVRLRQDAKSRAISLGKQAAASKRRAQKAHEAIQVEEEKKRHDIEAKAAARKTPKPVRGSKKKSAKIPQDDPELKERKDTAKPVPESQTPEKKAPNAEMHIPVEYKTDFIDDPINALRELAGVSTSSSHPLKGQTPKTSF